MVTADSKGVLAAWISLLSNIALTIIKIIVGTLFHSTALVADGVHNGADVIASIATLSSIKVANQPADKEHPYGHGKAEDIASGIISILLLFAALFLIYEASLSLFKPAHKVSFISLLAAILSLVWKYILYLYTIRVGREKNRKSLIATAYDHLSDVYASIAAVLGIGLAFLGDHLHLSIMAYGDPIAGIVVSLLILRVGLQMGKEAMNVLMESSVPLEKEKAYREVVLSLPEVKRIDRLRAREHGPYVLIDIRIGVPANLTIQEGHDITRYIRDTIMEKHPDVEEVLIHLNPWYPDQGTH